jgi:hypothetical protein
VPTKRANTEPPTGEAVENACANNAEKQSNKVVSARLEKLKFGIAAESQYLCE